MIKTHLTVLEDVASKSARSAAFRIPELDTSSNRVKSWTTITYEEFYRDVETFAKYWTQILGSNNIPQRSIIGVWLSGFLYTDVLHIYGLSRAGYVPQLFSIRLPNPIVIYELMRRAGASALVHDPSFSNILGDSPYFTHAAEDVRRLDLQHLRLRSLPDVTSEDLAFVFHTSGSTSGSPKLVRANYRWLSSALEKSHHLCYPCSPQRQDVTVFMGSMCHIAQNFMFLGTLQHGACTVQPTVLKYSPEELKDMVTRCGLNRLNQFASFLGNQLRASRQDSRLLSMLISLDDVVYSGLPLPREEEQYAYKHGIKIRNLFGSTEVGAMLLSGGCERNLSLVAPLPGTSYRFVPTASKSEQNQSAHRSNAELFELVILSESPDCPDVSLRHADGHFHTGDLFQEVMSGFYLYRGRDDDWIKSENSLRCDTKAIEDNARAMCGTLIAECVVVGTGRPSPVMFIEPGLEMNQDKLKKDIFRKIRLFHSRRYLHEQIVSPDMIVVVAKSTLPRTATKGNIRRQAVEEMFRLQIDDIFARVR
ncbi:hypothetical protein AGABI1DRAFT_108925 [Agaricus bisporus var. burnettii JB137-S8]|uniref:AMP-dependent synthetase/ligase domain-containing protein n=1 Tax=Agaricus bisporus var. burnettii (strain JB137-S8 / ATCC MYA-4627 / FGSC 10392) TaxID=597362 RepID=K5WLK1_AGABU|nr:uncharacterized protein AGABI1DRAFT_108925 [Agaricus bisporus var. burnettii JB137-S8]EKM76166.1 hypothetical protein AGABI1DRAFT_108925 [Agaricus bisporus var. burnettii JB137-S8]